VANSLQLDDTSYWEPPAPAEVNDKDSATRRDLEDMLEETMILIDQSKETKQGEASLHACIKEQSH
jgi:hypothetical protein